MPQEGGTTNEDDWVQLPAPGVGSRQGSRAAQQPSGVARTSAGHTCCVCTRCFTISIGQKATPAIVCRKGAGQARMKLRWSAWRRVAPTRSHAGAAETRHAIGSACASKISREICRDTSATQVARRQPKGPKQHRLPAPQAQRSGRQPGPGPRGRCAFQTRTRCTRGMRLHRAQSDM